MNTSADCSRASFGTFVFNESQKASYIACIACKWNDRDNVARTVPILLRADLSVAIYTYDGSSSWYMQRYAWMRRLAQWRDTPAFKNKYSTCLQSLRLATGMYSHVWFLDADLILPPYNEMKLFFRYLKVYNAIITQPSILRSDHKFVHRNHSCNVRSTNFVEVQAPVIRVSALHALAKILPGGNVSDWGVDMLWCEYLKQALQTNKTCIVINTNVAHPVRTLPRMYSLQNARDTLNCLKRKYAKFYIAKQRTLSCLHW